MKEKKKSQLRLTTQNQLLDRDQQFLYDEDVVIIKSNNGYSLGIVNMGLSQFDIVDAIDGKLKHKSKLMISDYLTNHSYEVIKYYETKEENSKGLSEIFER